MSDVYTYDASRVANFGRDTSRAYTALVRAQKKLCSEINEAIDNGVRPVKIAGDIIGRCSSHEARVNLLSLLLALANMDRIPQSIVKPFEKGIQPQRV